MEMRQNEEFTCSDTNIYKNIQIPLRKWIKNPLPSNNLISISFIIPSTISSPPFLLVRAHHVYVHALAAPFPL